MHDFKIVDKILVEYNEKGGNVTIPDGVEIIGGAVFYDCKKLTTVIIPDGVTDIGSYAFAHCTGITSVIIPGSVKRIGYGAFAHCSRLTSITIGNGVTSIGNYAFEDCSKLNSVTIENGVTYIGSAAFRDCSSLTSVTIPDSVTSIGEYAFCGCTWLNSVTIPDSVTSIGNGAFYGCSKLTSAKANYKAFSLTRTKKLVCKDKIYTVGKRSIVRGGLTLCQNGIHYCTDLFDIFNYYDGGYGKDFVVGICKVSDENIGGSTFDSKRCARWIIPTKILTREEVIKILNNK